MYSRANSPIPHRLVSPERKLDTTYESGLNRSVASAFQSDVEQSVVSPVTPFAQTKCGFLVGCLCLVVLVLAESSVGPASNFIPAKAASIKMAWRGGQAAVIFLLPALYTWYQKRNEINMGELMSFAV
jgi:uncharacterized membrane protein YdcZ (DUF606 family)